MADQPARSITLQVRMTPEEVALIERIGRRMSSGAHAYSDIRKIDGTLNQSAVVRHLLHEEAQAKGYRNA